MRVIALIVALLIHARVCSYCARWPNENAILFISGCAENMVQLFPLIDTVILLSAPIETIMERLAVRSPKADISFGPLNVRFRGGFYSR